MLSKHCESSEVDRRTWLHGSPAVTLTKYLQYKRLILSYFHHFKSDFINDLDHMRFSGTEPTKVCMPTKIQRPMIILKGRSDSS